MSRNRSWCPSLFLVLRIKPPKGTVAPSRHHSSGVSKLRSHTCGFGFPLKLQSAINRIAGILICWYFDLLRRPVYVERDVRSFSAAYEMDFQRILSFCIPWYGQRQVFWCAFHTSVNSASRCMLNMRWFQNVDPHGFLCKCVAYKGSH